VDRSRAPGRSQGCPILSSNHHGQPRRPPALEVSEHTLPSLNPREAWIDRSSASRICASLPLVGRDKPAAAFRRRARPSDRFPRLTELLRRVSALYPLIGELRFAESDFCNAADARRGLIDVPKRGCWRATVTISTEGYLGLDRASAPRGFCLSLDPHSGVWH
jgi:hypothetical protein